MIRDFREDSLQAMRLAPERKRALDDRGPGPSVVSDASRLDVGAADIPTKDSMCRRDHALGHQPLYHGTHYHGTHGAESRSPRARDHEDRFPCVSACFRAFRGEALRLFRSLAHAIPGPDAYGSVETIRPAAVNR